VAANHDSPLGTLWESKHVEENSAGPGLFISPWEQNNLAWAIDHANQQGFAGGARHRDRIVEFGRRLFGDPVYRGYAGMATIRVGTLDKAGTTHYYHTIQHLGASNGWKPGGIGMPLSGFHGAEARLGLMIARRGQLAGAESAYQTVHEQLMGDLVHRAGWAIAELPSHADEKGKTQAGQDSTSNERLPGSRDRLFGQQDLQRLPLLKKDDLQYLGGFRLPAGKSGVSEFAFGGTALAFNPSKTSLFLVGHDWHQAVAEVSIPKTLARNARLQDWPVASCSQQLVDVKNRIPHNTLKGNVKIGGLLVVDGKLIGSVYVFYDAEAKARDSHFRLDSLDLSRARVSGLYQTGNLGGGFTGGYMAEVPQEWRKALGTRYLTGQAALAIIGRTSSGPALFGFDPTALGASGSSAIPYVYYPLSKPLAKMDAKNPFFNGTTEIKGVCFVPGTRSVLFFGSHGTGKIYYGEAAEANDKARNAKGFHSVNGEYQYQVWAYDASDFAAVRSGKRKPWDVKPYAVWKLEFPIEEGGKHIGGVAFDAKTRRIYVSQLHADEWGRPLVHCLGVPTK
jgi:hypothetical protein